MEEERSMNGINKPKFKRRQYLVAKKFQLRYVGWILLFMFLTAVLCSYIIYYTTMVLLGEKLANVYPQGRLLSIVHTVNFRILMSFLVASPLVIVIGIYLSHKIAGPIYRMERFLDNMAAGDFSSRIVLRLGDELMTLADAMNRLGDSLKSNVTDERARLDKISAELENIRAFLADNPTAASGIISSIQRLDTELTGLKKDVDRFKV
jgi:methyl-accepting chemotaxis protein